MPKATHTPIKKNTKILIELGEHKDALDKIAEADGMLPTPKARKILIDAIKAQSKK